MDLSEFSQTFITAVAGGVIGGIISLVGWIIQNIYFRKEHHARIEFNIMPKVIDIHKDKAIVFIDASLNNKGHVPLKIDKILIKVYGFHSEDLFVDSKDNDKGLNFRHEIHEFDMVPQNWKDAVVRPNVVQNYHRVKAIPTEMRCILIKGEFHYKNKKYKPHATAVVIKIEPPNANWANHKPAISSGD